MNESEQEKAGVREWAPVQLNVGVGCSYACEYCYARCFALKFRRIQDRSQWAQEKLRERPPKIRKFEGQVMFPSAHDISPNYLPAYRSQLKALLEAGNDVLIVTKPRLDHISQLCREFASHKARIIFRFTIGSLNRKLTQLWEPDAPEPAERRECLELAFRKGFTTSVSMEPMLAGTEDAVATFHALVQYVTETVWIGKMNHLNRWGPAKPEIAIACQYLRHLQSDAGIKDLVKKLGDHPQIRWKDSIRDVLRRPAPPSSRYRRNRCDSGADSGPG